MAVYVAPVRRGSQWCGMVQSERDLRRHTWARLPCQPSEAPKHHGSYTTSQSEINLSQYYIYQLIAIIYILRETRWRSGQ
jgi:hypothetical protein